MQDLDGVIEGIAFGNTFSNVKEVLKTGNIVLIDGMLKNKDGVYSLSVKNVREWKKENQEEAETTSERNVVFVVKFPHDYAAVYPRVKEICAAYKGGVEVYLLIDGKYYRPEQTVADNETLLAELYGAVGPENVEVKERKK